MTLVPVTVPVALIQGPPIFDTITVLESVSYQTQLSIVDGTPPFIFTTTTAPLLTVNPGGAVISTGVLSIGTYVVGGTVTDSVGNSGSWNFTLRVVAGASSPQTTITQVEAVMPTGIEMQVPFQIDPATGGVAFLFNYNEIIAQHIETICLTVLGERLMMPGYGTGLEAQLFEPITEPASALIAKDIMTQVQGSENRIKVNSVNVGSPDATSGVLTITVNYTILPLRDQNTLRVTVGGTILQVNSP
jgi:phage baseplate assembly protein W